MTSTYPATSLEPPAGIAPFDLAQVAAELPVADGYDVEMGRSDDGACFASIIDPLERPWLIEKIGPKFSVTPPFDNGLTGPTLAAQPIRTRFYTAADAAASVKRRCGAR